MISHSVPVDPRDPKPLILALALVALLPKEQLESLLLALGAVPLLAPYLRHLMPPR